MPGQYDTPPTGYGPFPHGNPPSNVDLMLSVVRLEERVVTLQKDVKTLVESLPNYVTQTEHKPIRLVVYGMVALLLTTVFGALLNTVVKDANGAQHAAKSADDLPGPGTGGHLSLSNLSDQLGDDEDH